jgi:hypothetical protein
LTENQKRAYILADNRLAETGGGWDKDMLRIEMDEIDWGEFNEFNLEDFGDLDLDAFNAEEVEPPMLESGDRAPFRQMTFTLHDKQFEEVDTAVSKAKKEGGDKSAVNENSNGNALAWICERFNRGKC